MRWVILTLGSIMSGFVTGQTEPDSGINAPVSVFDSNVYQDLFGTQAMRMVFNDKAMVQQWLNVEIALATAQAEIGVIPSSAAVAIERAAKIENIDFDELRQGINRVGRGISPLLSQIRAAGDEEVSEYLHLGSTTQDIMDTATVLQIKAGVNLIRQELVKLTLKFADLAATHKDTVMLARSNGQDAVPTTFGLHLTTFMMELYRHVQRVDESVSRLQAQIGSTVGTLAPYGDKGFELQERLAQQLGLAVPIVPWNPSRDSFAEIVQTLGLINATLGRLATDVNNLGRTQIDEIKEGEGGASSTMPQKRNPRASEFIGGFARMGKMYNSAALDMMSHSDTRQGSPWILEWSIVPEAFMVTSASIDRAQGLLINLIVNKDNMLSNFKAANNFAMSEAVMNALAQKIGRGDAYAAVESAIKAADPKDTLKNVVEKNELINRHFSQQEIDALMIPANYLGSASKIVERSVSAVRAGLM